MLYFGCRMRTAWIILSLVALVPGVGITTKGLALGPREDSDEQAAELDETLKRMRAEVEQLFGTGKHEDALVRAREALKLSQDGLGMDDPRSALWLSNVAILLRGMGEYAEAEPLFRQSLLATERIYGPEHPSVATCLDSLAGIHRTLGDYAQAELLVKRSLAIREKSLGPDHPDVGTTLNNLALLHRVQGRHAQAEGLYKRSLAIREKTLGRDHPQVATTLNNLAKIYYDQGEYLQAEPLYRRALAILEDAVGEDHPNVAGCLNNLAEFYHDQGEYAQAEALYTQSLGIFEKLFGPDHPSVATSLNNLAELHRAQGKHAQAEPLYKRSLAIREKALGAAHPDVALTLHGLAEFYRGQGEYVKAEPLYRRALAILEDAVGEDHPNLAGTLNNLAEFYHDQGKYAQAEALYTQSLGIFEKVFGPDHPSVATCLNNLATLYFANGDYSRAEARSSAAFEKKLVFIARTAGGLPESRAVTLREKWAKPGFLLSVIRKLPARDPQGAHNVAWRSRAVVTRLLVERRQISFDSPAAKALYERLRSSQQQLAQLTLADVSPEHREVRHRRLIELNDEKEALEAELAQVSAPFRREIELERIGPNELARALPSDTAVIDIAAINLWERQPDGGRLQPTPHYEAFILQPASDAADPQVSWVHLGPVEPIDEALAAWRKAIIERQALPPSDDRPDRILRRLVWDKLEPHLEEHLNVYIIPDGELAFLPWATLPGRRPGTCLIEDYNIVIASHGQELYRGLTEASSDSSGVLLVGNVDYDRGPAAPAAELLATADTQTPRTRSPAPGTESVWRRLPATAEEVASIRQTWDSRGPLVMLRGEEAGESAVRAHLPGNRYIHLATHGFFADEKFRSMFGHDVGGEQLFGEPGVLATSRGQVTARNPLILSGVVLAGANLPPKTDELGLPTGQDGILTAEEIVSFDLRGTELVVLSACETGLGSVGGGEGVFGLQRAFHLAGARNVIASLWKVDDQAAAALMRVFYHKLWHENKSPAVALREAQLTLYRQPDQIDKLAVLRGPDFDKIVSRKDRQFDPTHAPADIRRWAAFVLSGPGR